MNTKARRLADRYLVALRTHLEQEPEGSLDPADQLGREALRMGLKTLDLAQIHDVALVALMPPASPSEDGDGAIARAGRFFRRALTPLAAAQVPDGGGQAKPPDGKSRRGAADVTAAKQRLQREAVRRREAEAALKKSQRHYGQLLAQSRLMQQQLRHLSHQILLAQEEERRHISRELHDEISQILTGINVKLAALKIEVTTNTGNLRRKIANTQRLVEKSVAAVHRFARELRPAMLDDLGLIPTLVTFMKDFGQRTGLQIRFQTVGADKLEPLDSVRRTALYRVAQEALTNVAKHAEASLARVSLRLEPGAVAMTISDNGKSFEVAAVLGARRCKRLGIIGMRERVEMLGGTFAIASAPGEGTTVDVRMPLRNGVAK